MPQRQTLRRRGRQTPLVVALYLNAGLLACLLTAFLSRDSSSAAFAAPPVSTQPLAGGNGLYLMPGQFAVNVWGCYVMDTQRQTLVAYEYTPNQKQLRLVASRFYGHDLQLREYNTLPPVSEIERLVQLQNNPVRGVPQGQQPGGVQPNGDAKDAPPAGNDPIRPPGERPFDRPPQPGDADFVPKASDINPPKQ